MRRRVAVLVAALFVAAGWFVVTAPDGGAAGALETAWWWQGEPATGAVPPPPTVPDGGLWVSSNATGAQAISALRVTLDAGATAPTLSLDVHQSVPQTGIDLVVYPTSAPWTAGPSQAWSSKPAYDVNGVHAVGTMSGDSKHVTFDLSGLVTGDVLSVVIAPAPNVPAPATPLPSSPPPAPPTFDVTFEKPGPATVAVSPAATPEPDQSAAAATAPESAPLEDVGALPTDSFASAGTIGLSAPLPASVASAPARSAPAVAFNNGPRSFVPASVKRSATDSAAIAVMLGLVLVWVARDTAASGGTRRRRLSLYDAPKPAEALAVARAGTPPPIR